MRRLQQESQLSFLAWTLFTAGMSQDRVIIDNALVRCVRNDREAAPLFELVRADLGLWVWELAVETDRDADVQIEQIRRELEVNRAKLASLAVGSTDFVLFLSVAAIDDSMLRITNKLARLVAECGLELEIVIQSRG